MVSRKYRITVYECLECGEFVSEYDLDEHCIFCSATIEDFEEVGIFTVEADNLSDACDKAIELAELKEVDSNG